MNSDKKKLYALSVFLFAVLTATLLVGRGNSRIVTAILMLPLATVTCLLIKKRSSVSINKKEVLLLSTVMAALYAVLKEMTGVYFGFYHNPYFVNLKWLLQYILPSAIIIVATEIIRFVLLSQKNRFVSVMAYLSCVVAEILMFSSLAGITSYYRFMDLVGMNLFPAISANFYYHYVSKRYGMMPNIVFRLITSLYIYFIPTITGMTDAIGSCIKICLPILLLALTAALYEKSKKNAVRKGKKLGWAATLLTAVAIASVAMLISCQFRFGALVIATDSMTGEINKGDVIIYERYDGQTIEEGQVIVFLQNEAKIIHRVVEIEHIGGETRYYTKGDANEDRDVGYRLSSDIVGLTNIKLAHLGYPTLWLREIIQK